MESNYQKFLLDLKTHIDKIQNYHRKNQAINSKIDLAKELKKYPNENVEMFNNTDDVFRGIIATFLNNPIKTSQSLDIYCLSQTKLISQTIGILNWVTSEFIKIKDKSIPKEYKDNLYQFNLEFKSIYTEKRILEILKNELERICKLNGVILE